jgi:hypothetical protein
MPPAARTRLVLGLAVAVGVAVLATFLILGRAPVTGDAAAPAATPGPGPGPTTVATSVVEVAAEPGDDGDPAGAAPDPDGAATPVEAVRGFVGSLGAGNPEQAYRLMHPRHRDRFDSYAAFLTDAGPAEQFGPFAVLGDGAYQSATFAGEVANEQVAVVSVYGTVTRDGEQRTEAVSVAARRAGSGWLVDAVGSGGSVFQNPGTAGEQLTAGEDLVLWTPSGGLLEVLAVVDGEPRTTTVTELDVPSETAEVRVDDYSPGVQQAAVGVLREDGSVVGVATFFAV